MDAPEISILREEEEESPPPDPDTPFTKFRVHMERPWVTSGGVSGSGTGSGTGSLSAQQGGGSMQDSEEEEDQLIDDDELAIVTETGQPTSPGIGVTDSSTPSPRKRGGVTRGRQRRGGPTGRRGRPGREPPDAAAMMSTFEVTKADQTGMISPHIITPTTAITVGITQQQQNINQASDDSQWTTAPPPKPPRKKPGPKKGSTLGPRGPRKAPSKTAQNTPGTSTPLYDEQVGSDATQFLIPASIPTTPKSDQPCLPPPNLPPIPPPDFSLEPNVPVPLYPLPIRSFPVQPPPKIPTGYAPSHPVDTKRGPVRSWAIMQREVRGIAGGRWFARAWVAPSTLPHNFNHIGPGLGAGIGTSGQITRPPTPPMPIHHFPLISSGLTQLDSLAQVAACSSRLPTVKAEALVEMPLSTADKSTRDIETSHVQDIDMREVPLGLASSGLVSRSSASPSPTPPATEEINQDTEMQTTQK